MPANRIAIYLTGLGNLIAGVAPFVLGLDIDGFEEAGPYISAILGVNAVVVTWLYNWGKWEERKDFEAMAADAPVELTDKTMAPKKPGA